MKSPQCHASPTSTWRLVLLASLAGGIAEIVWVSLYAAFNPLSVTTVARAVTASLLPWWATGAAGAWLGFLIHMSLAVLLGTAFAHVLWKPFVRARGLVATLTAAVLTLAVVWAFNFFMLLPWLNPEFITLMPYPVTFASKMLFALSMTLVLSTPEIKRVLSQPRGAFSSHR